MSPEVSLPDFQGASDNLRRMQRLRQNGILSGNLGNSFSGSGACKNLSSSPTIRFNIPLRSEGDILTMP